MPNSWGFRFTLNNPLASHLARSERTQVNDSMNTIGLGVGIRPYWSDGQVTIYHGDCRQIVPLLPTVDLLLTDPPYGINVCARGTIGSDPTPRSRRRHRIAARCTRFGRVTWDAAPPEPWVLEMLISRAKWAVLWGGNYYPRMERATCWLVWDKKVPSGVGFAHAELAWTNLNRAVRLFRWRWSGMLQEDMAKKERRVHPTQKPVALMEWCIGKARGAQTILDPFMGSGTTLLAARRAGLTAIGIDREESYCEAAVKRLQEDRGDDTMGGLESSPERCTASGPRIVAPPMRPAAVRRRSGSR